MYDPKKEATHDRYEELELLGHGGMGSVHRVHDRAVDRVLALKRLRPQHERNRAGLTEMFRQEFRTLAQLQHPHIVSVYDFAVDTRGAYYTMEWLEGSDLQALAPLAWRDACALGRDVCSALAFLHSRRLIHRDPSPRNIKRLSSGRAKLLDFGGMMAMGIARNTVGTAPLVAPEVLLQQTLDARTDLYAFGATLYYALTGRHAYPAHALGELHALWRVPPMLPSDHVAGIPHELDQLILSLLSLEPGARPRSAAEVIDRMSAIADLPRGEQESEPSAYLATPQLVGRQADLNHIRARLRDLHTGHGGVVWIEGKSGVGRSRMLAASVLEAKLAGARAVTARADGTFAAYGLLRELLHGFHDDSDEAGAQLIARLDAGAADQQLDRLFRAELQRAFCDLVRRRASRVPVVLAVDDIERADVPSQAALARLVHDAGNERVLVVATSAHRPDRAGHPALTLLAEDAVSLELSPLRGEETRQLLGSMFGEVPNLGALAVRIHAIAEGSPRGAVELAQWLVDERQATYAMGAWLLPTQSEDARLPVSLTGARSERLQALSAEARALASAIAFADGAGLLASAYRELSAETDPARAQAALDELVRGQILQRDGLHYVFESQVWLPLLRERAPMEEARQISRRIAATLHRHGRDPLEVARYSWLAGDTAHLVATLLGELQHGSRWDRCPRDYAAMLTAAVAACPELGRSRRDWFVLLRELVKVGQDLSVPNMRGHLTALFSQLALDSGLHDADSEAVAGLAPPERLQRILELAQQRYDNTPEPERCLNPIEAITTITWLTSETAALAAQISDVHLLDIAPSLEPFVPLAPAIQHVQEDVVPATRHLLAGRFEASIASHRRSLELVRGEHEFLDEATRAWAFQAIHYVLGCLGATLGLPGALEHAAVLERTPTWIVPAWTVRSLYYASVGNVREAERARKHLELVQLQSPIKPPLVAGSPQQQVYTASLCEDVTALRHAIAELRPLSEQHPSFAPFLDFAVAEHARVCGDATKAVELYAALSSRIVAGEYALWAWVVGGWMTALLSLERCGEALALGLRSLAEAERVQLEGMKHFIQVPLALVYSALERHDEARTLLDAVVVQREQYGLAGVNLGWAYEARARLALAADDRAGFEKYATLCRRQYRKSGDNPALAARYERLLHAARQTGAGVRAELAETLSRSTSANSVHTTYQRDRDLHRKLRGCRDPKERAQTALTILLERARVRHGDLYLLRDEGLVCAATTAPEHDQEAFMLASRLIEPADDSQHVTRACTVHDPGHSAVVPLLLTYRSRGEAWLVGVAVLRDDPDHPAVTPLDAATALAKALADQDGVKPRPVASAVGR